jgi:pimeloyl-ACP methyl ester carboxylesterase
VREDFAVPAVGGDLCGWTEGDGVPVLLLHGGPGLGYEYLDELAADIGDGYRVIAFQQRGLSPSTAEGPFTVAQAIDDVIAVMDGLALARTMLAGHSWGAHLALRMAAAHPDRILGALVIEPIGVVGDGGASAFEAEITARMSRTARDRMMELDERVMAGAGGPADLRESMGLVWPAYFADPAHTSAMPEPRLSLEANSSLSSEVTKDTAAVAAGLSEGKVPYHVIAGAGSPIPWGQAANTSAELSPLGSLSVFPGAGHFPWFESPGCVRAGLERLEALCVLEAAQEVDQA